MLLTYNFGRFREDSKLGQQTRFHTNYNVNLGQTGKWRRDPANASSCDVTQYRCGNSQVNMLGTIPEHQRWHFYRDFHNQNRKPDTSVLSFVTDSWHWQNTSYAILLQAILMRHFDFLLLHAWFIDRLEIKFSIQFSNPTWTFTWSLITLQQDVEY